MIAVRRSQERGHADHGWLHTHHTFSFDRYYDPRRMGFRVLRVLSEDRAQPGKGFPTHRHRDMEIITYVLSGELAHQDSTGGGSVIRRGEVQRMTAGRGVLHSEANPSTTNPAYFLQIWILPEETGLTPGYEQRSFPDAEKTGRLCLYASRDGRGGSLPIHQDTALYCSILESGGLGHELLSDRHAWVQAAAGALSVNGQTLSAGDGAAVSEERELVIESRGHCEFLLFDLP